MTQTITDYVRHRRLEKQVLQKAREANEAVLFDDFSYMRKRRRWKSFEEYLEWKHTTQAYSWPNP